MKFVRILGINSRPPWHFAEVAPGAEYNPQTAAPEGDVIQAISSMEDILRSKVSDVKTGEMSLGKKEALRFLIHFIGDIHQPLHVGNGKDREAFNAVCHSGNYRHDGIFSI